jgi:hypothetical protein
MNDIEHELRQYIDTTEAPADQDELAELVAELASEAHAAMLVSLATEEPTATEYDPNEIPF